MVSLPAQVSSWGPDGLPACTFPAIFSGYNIMIMLSCYQVNSYQEDAAGVLRAALRSPIPGYGAALAVTVYRCHCGTPRDELQGADPCRTLSARSSSREDARSHRFCRRG